MATPLWAQNLTQQVCSDYKRKLPRMVWYTSREKQYRTVERWQDGDRRGFRILSHTAPASKYSSGRTWPSGKVFVRAGTDQQDATLVLLHELAHHILNKTRSGRKQGHTIKFWRLAFELYQRYGVDLEYAFGREKSYKKKATQAYQELTNK